VQRRATETLRLTRRTLTSGLRRCHLQPRVGDYALRAITPKLVNRELVAPMRSAGVGEPTIRQALMVLQAIFTYAHAEDRVPDNPIKVTKPRQAVEREVPPVPPVTVERLRARLATRDALMVAVLAYAGLRPQELLALRWDDVVDGALRIRRKNVHGQLFPYTKTRQNRRVKLLAPLGADLAEWALASGRRTIRAAREPGVREVGALFDPTLEALS